MPMYILTHILITTRIHIDIVNKRTHTYYNTEKTHYMHILGNSCMYMHAYIQTQTKKAGVQSPHSVPHGSVTLCEEIFLIYIYIYICIYIHTYVYI
jgi:hypothetical protein